MEVMIDGANGCESEREEEREEEEETLHMLMMNVIDSYWIILKEREKRKSVIREHGLIDVYRILGRERLLSNEEQSVRVLMRRFARFLDAETTEKLIQSFLNEKRLIKRIKCLQTYHCLGIKTLAGGELYERLREKREKTRERMKASLDLIIKNNKCYYIMY
ncbi:PREDICTED: transcriptional adapter 2-alpha-like isoform X3 [Amphimedon queenslandica]|uniref:Transcriptional adapter 2-alpha/beta-like domain-containing protein n=1 Tax=Amphimedon queenslandica TaxID=400682 RepID=A0AAN0K1M7_AMPQE|nr:PREDICTED: transcriptional adapter 2-alpha-like isoform X3 [Amphimedon queenslandica]|eukprot:XP_019863066.1 PREDICTED: transcriptional adapter 2-alpha-like isoform X3 [Amphimedon queenslandica]